MTKDYYKILEVSEFSTQEEIKKAYRKLARKWHPDVAGNTPDVISAFKEINEAYELLSDSVKKADYDRARKFYNYANKKNESVKQEENKGYSSKPNSKETTSDFMRKSASQGKKNKKGFSFNWEEFLAKKYRADQFKKEKNTDAAQKGNDIYTDVSISIFEAINGTTKVLNMLQTQVCPKCAGRKFVNGSKCSNCNGSGEISNYKRFSVKIPAGIKDKSKIRLAEEGEKGINGGKNGDLYLTIHIIEPKNYKTEGLNILKTVQIAPYEAVLGTVISVPTLKGSVSVKIPANTVSGQKIRLNGCGIEASSKIGDMIITVEIQLPKTLSQAEIELYKKLKEISSSDVRA